MSGRKAKALRRANPRKSKTASVLRQAQHERNQFVRPEALEGRPLSPRPFSYLAAAGLMTGALAPATGWALPQGGAVAAGSATVSTPTSISMRIDQGTDRLIMDWTRFNIAANEAVRFQQPSAASIALNRVAGLEPSSIFGSLSANGQVMLVNPGGILFGPSARIDVGALTASTLNITNQDFLSGTYRFTQDPNFANAAVVNQGLITAGPGGYVALLGAAVRNEGVIQANLGSIAMGAGKAETLDLRGDGLIGFVVTDAVSGSVTGPSGESLASYVSNTGILQADGGTVTLAANAAKDFIASVVNQEGFIRATSLVNHGGVVKLVAEGDNSIAWNKGTIDVSAGEANAASGNVLVSGPYAGNSGAILAKGADGATGGHVEVTSSKETILFSGSTIDVSGIGNSNAGSIRIWSDKETVFAPNASLVARGGEAGGNGGFIEFSSGNSFSFEGLVDTAAPKGMVGTFLLDPIFLFLINGVSGTGDQDSNISGGALVFTDADTANNTVSVGKLASLGNINIQLEAKDTLTVGDSGGGSATVSLPSLTTNTITLQAGDSTTVGGGNVTFNAGSSLTTGGGGVLIVAGDSSTQKTGTATLGAISTSGGAILVFAQTGSVFNSALNAGGGDIILVSPTLTFNAVGTDFIANGLGIQATAEPLNFTTSGVTVVAAKITGAGNGYAYFSSGDFTVGTVGGGTIAGITTNNGPIQLVATAGNITLSQDVNAGTSTVRLSASGTISQTFGTITASGLGLTATSQPALTLAGSLTKIAANITGAGNPFSFTQAGSLDVGKVGNPVLIGGEVVGITTNGGDVTLTSSTGNLTLSQNVDAGGGNVSLTATAGTITETTGAISGALLTTNSVGGTTLNTSNIVGSFNATNSTSGGIQFNDTATPLLTITGITNSALGTIVTTTGSIATSGTISAATTGVVTLTAGGNVITVGAPISAVSGNVTLSASNGVTLNDNLDAGSGRVIINADSNGDGTGTFSLLAGKSITTTNTSNFLGAGPIAVQIIAADIDLQGTITPGTNGDVGLFTIAGRTVGVGSGAGLFSVNNTEINNVNVSGTGFLKIGGLSAGALHAAGVNFTGGRNLVLVSGSTIDDDGTTNAAVTTTGALGFTSGGTIGGSSGADGFTTNVGTLGVLSSGGNAITITNVGGNALTVGNTLPGGTVGIATGGAGDISITQQASNISVTQPITTTGNVALIVSAGSISETGSGAISGALLATSSVTGTILNGANTVSSFTASNTSSGNIELTNTANPLTITGITQTGTGLFVNITNTGSLVTSGPITGVGSGAFLDILLQATGDMTIGADVTSTGGAPSSVLIFATGANTLLSHTAGTISANNVNGSVQLGADRIALSGGTISAVNSGSGTVNLTRLNPGSVDLGSTVDSTASTLELSNAELNTISADSQLVIGGNGPIAVSAPINLASLAGRIQLTNDSGNVGQSGGIAVNSSLTVPGGVLFLTDSAVTGSGAISTSSLETQSQTGSTLTGANTVSSFTATNSTSGDISFTNTANPLTITGISNNGGGNIIVANTGAIVISANPVQTTGGNGNITITAASPLTVNANVTAAGSGAITLTAQNPGDLTLNAMVSSGTGPINLNAGGNVIIINGTVSTGGAVTVMAGNDIVTGGFGAPSIWSIGSSVTLQAGQDILLGQAGAFGDVYADTNITMNAGRDIVVDEFSFVFADQDSGTTGGSVMGTAGRNLLLSATNATGAQIAAFGSGSINLSAGQDMVLGANTAGLTTLGTGGITLNAVNSITANTLIATGGGAISLTSPTVTVTVPPIGGPVTCTGSCSGVTSTPPPSTGGTTGGETTPGGETTAGGTGEGNPVEDTQAGIQNATLQLVNPLIPTPELLSTGTVPDNFFKDAGQSPIHISEEGEIHRAGAKKGEPEGVKIVEDEKGKPEDKGKPDEKGKPEEKPAKADEKPGKPEEKPAKAEEKPGKPEDKGKPADKGKPEKPAKAEEKPGKAVAPELAEPSEEEKKKKAGVPATPGKALGTQPVEVLEGGEAPGGGGGVTIKPEGGEKGGAKEEKK